MTASGRPATGLTPSFRLAALLLAACASATADVLSPGAGGSLAVLAAVGLLATPGAVCDFGKRLAALALFGVVGLGLVLLAPAPSAEPASEILGLRVSDHALRFHAALWLRCALIVAWGAVLGRGLGERNLLAALGGLPVPGRLASLCYLMVRSIGDVSRELQTVVRAARARGNPTGLRAVAASGSIAGSLVLRLSLRAETRAMALVARGFEGRLPSLERRPLRAREVLLLAVWGGLLALVCGL